MKYLGIFLFVSMFVFSGCFNASKKTTEKGTKMDSSLVKHKFELAGDVEWARPKNFPLTMDIYTPKTGRASYPVLVIFHGGGWLINNKSIMNQMAEYFASNAEFVVCNVNYRLLVDNGNTTMLNEMIEDAMGAVLWIKDNIGRFGGDSTSISVTGDSAGGHLAAMVMVGARKLKSLGFAGNDIGFCPTYLPKGKSAEKVAAENGLAVKAALLSYPAIDIYQLCMGHSADGSDGFESEANVFWSFANSKPRSVLGNGVNVVDNPEYYKMCSANYMIPDSKDGVLPYVFCQVGTRDETIQPQWVKEYAELLKEKGYNVEYWVYEDRPHAYLDSGSNEYLKINFEKDAITAINKMIEFLNSIFY